MKKLLIAAGIAGLAYYLKKNPHLVDEAKDKAMQCYDSMKEKLGNKASV